VNCEDVDDEVAADNINGGIAGIGVGVSGAGASAAGNGAGVACATGYDDARNMAERLDTSSCMDAYVSMLPPLFVALDAGRVCPWDTGEREPRCILFGSQWDGRQRGVSKVCTTVSIQQPMIR
jgi:hypothetical protein